MSRETVTVACDRELTLRDAPAVRERFDWERRAVTIDCQSGRTIEGTWDLERRPGRAGRRGRRIPTRNHSPAGDRTRRPPGLCSRPDGARGAARVRLRARRRRPRRERERHRRDTAAGRPRYRLRPRHPRARAPRARCPPAGGRPPRSRDSRVSRPTGRGELVYTSATASRSKASPAQRQEPT